MKALADQLMRVVGSVRVRAALALGVLVGIGAVHTGAYWTDAAEIEVGTLNSGTLDIKLGDPAVDNEPPQFTADFTLSDMVPGASRDAALQVSNDGTVPLTFSVSGTASETGAETEQMAGALVMSVYPSSEGGSCSGTALVTDVPAVGQILPEQAILAAGDARSFCLRVRLPSDADSGVQGTSAALTMTFEAKQVNAP